MPKNSSCIGRIIFLATKLPQPLGVGYYVSLAVIVGVLTIICYAQYNSIYRESGHYLLRFIAYLIPFSILKALLNLFATLNTLFFNKTFSQSSSNVSLLIILAFSLFSILSLSIQLYIDFRLIQINKKIKCSKLLNEQSIQKLDDFFKMPDGDERQSLYYELTQSLFSVSWLLKESVQEEKNSNYPLLISNCPCQNF